MASNIHERGGPGIPSGEWQGLDKLGWASHPEGVAFLGPRKVLACKMANPASSGLLICTYANVDPPPKKRKKPSLLYLICVLLDTAPWPPVCDF